MTYLERLKQLKTYQGPTDKTDRSTFFGFVSSPQAHIERPIALDWRAFVTRGLPPPAHPGERAEAIAYERRLVEWLNANPASSMPDKCAECGESETPGNVLKPYGTTTSVWLHSGCWPVWRDKRVEKARDALAAQGIMEDPYAGPAPKVIPWAREAPREADDAPPF